MSKSSAARRWLICLPIRSHHRRHGFASALNGGHGGLSQSPGDAGLARGQRRGNATMSIRRSIWPRRAKAWVDLLPDDTACCPHAGCATAREAVLTAELGARR